MTELHPLYRTPCTYVRPQEGASRRCGTVPTRRFINGWYCQSCVPRWEAVVTSWATPAPPQDTAKGP
ncbi:hypothetical protein AB0F88_17345 [Streptosporangium sp. NPDC023963]|uniref:hypothetical protein n=1 Tax=Streptosporangium sp. NPDC023963 TaxID=3155608 RepID=UPI00343D7904